MLLETNGFGIFPKLPLRVVLRDSELLVVMIVGGGSDSNPNFSKQEGRECVLPAPVTV